MAGVVVALFGLAADARPGEPQGRSLESQVLLYLLAVVIVAVVGGTVVALSSAVAAFLINYFFVKPVHTLDVAKASRRWRC